MSTPTRSDVAESTTASKTGAKAPRRGSSSRAAAARDGHEPVAMPWIPCARADDDPAFARRLGEWTDRLAPDGPVEHYLVERAVRASWQMDWADRRFTAMMTDAGDAPASNGSTAPAGPAGGYVDHQLGLGQMLLGALDTLGRLRGASRPRREKPARPRDGALRTKKASTVPRAARSSIARSPAAEPPCSPIAGVASVVTVAQAVEAGWSVLGSVEIGPVGLPSSDDPVASYESSPRPAGPLTRRSAHFLRRVGRANPPMPAGSHPQKRANEPNAPQIDAGNPRFGANEPNSARRTRATTWQNGANEPNARRRVGGYDVPLDSWDPGSKADHVPVRYRGTGRSLVGRLSDHPA
ncbi:MAG: hypothetical protein ACYC61_17470 [Isosphaeraceae bacterium]